MTPALHVVSVALCHSCFIHLASGLASPVSSGLVLLSGLPLLCRSLRLAFTLDALSANGTVTHSYLASNDSSLPLLPSVVLAALLSLLSSLTFKPRHAMHISVKLLLRHRHAVEIGMPTHLQYIDHARRTYTQKKGQPPVPVIGLTLIRRGQLPG